MNICPGCGREYSVDGYIRETEVGCKERYAATGETPLQAWCNDKRKYV